MVLRADALEIQISFVEMVLLAVGVNFFIVLAPFLRFRLGPPVGRFAVICG
jgi:hypothetical protein